MDSGKKTEMDHALQAGREYLAEKLHRWDALAWKACRSIADARSMLEGTRQEIALYYVNNVLHG